MPPNLKPGHQSHHSNIHNQSAIPEINALLSSALLKDMHVLLQIIDAKGGSKKASLISKSDDPEGGDSLHGDGGVTEGDPSGWLDWILGCLRLPARILLGDSLSRLFLAEFTAQLCVNADDRLPTEGRATGIPEAMSLANVLSRFLEERKRQRHIPFDTPTLGDAVVVGETPDLNAKAVQAAHKVVPGSLSFRPSLVPLDTALDAISFRINELRECCVSSKLPPSTAVSTATFHRLELATNAKELSASAKVENATVEESPLADAASTDAAAADGSLTVETTCFTPVGALHDDPWLKQVVDVSILDAWLNTSGDAHTLLVTKPSEVSSSAFTEAIMRLLSGTFLTDSQLSAITSAAAAEVASATKVSTSADHLLAALQRPHVKTSVGNLDLPRRVLGHLCFSRLLLKCRLTPHTVTAVGVHGYSPFTVPELIPPFLQPVCAKGALHVGAKALAKHIHRDKSEDWWCAQIYIAEDNARPPGTKKNPNQKRKGELVGSEATKNARSESVLAAVIGGAVWQNLHMLPHGHVAFELRQQGGYGARWCIMADPAAPGGAVFMFRGFLEPHAVDGHDKGWSH